MHVGIEGGSSSAKAVLVSQDGQILASYEGPHTNHWLIGEKECVKRIKFMVDKVMQDANKSSEKLLSLGLSLSGADTQKVCDDIKNAVISTHPDIANHVSVFNDTIGSMATATDSGGVVLIAGTGSICVLIFPDCSFYRVGGWGYMLGDEGSAYGIAYKGVKTVIDHEDGFLLTDFDITYCRKKIFEYFKITHRLELLTVFFREFDKSEVANLCKIFADGARIDKDALCMHLFYDGGYQLGRAVAAVAFKAQDSMLNQPGGLHVLCVGQVFKSWDLLKQGFLDGIKPKYSRDIQIPEITLLQLEIGAAFGGACVSAKENGTPINCDYSKNSSTFFHKKFQ